MEIKTAAVVLKTADYKENDKLLTLFSADRGKFTACIKGVRKPTARLRPAAQPFTLAEFVLSERRGFYTVTQAEVLDSFLPCAPIWTNFTAPRQWRSFCAF